MLPNEVIMELENQIKQELRPSLENIVENPQQHITQLLLLYQRLNFTAKIEQEMMTNQMISPQFIRELELYRDELVAELPYNFTHKQSSELLQALYHLQLALSLEQHEMLDVFSFEWISQPRTYLRDDEYVVEVGLLTESYGFDIIDLDGIIT